MSFKEKLDKIVKKNDSLLCIGLDIDKEKMPKYLFSDKKNPYLEFNEKIINSTKNLVCSYKINMAFYETLGLKGYKILEKTIELIPKEIPIILDGKRNDIGNTAKKYAKSIFEELSVDSTTVNPYLGIDGVKPFLEYRDKLSFILCRTSNPSAKDFQDLIVGKKNLYTLVAEKIKQWDNEFGNCGAVVGATYPGELKEIRRILGDSIPLLLPGIGAQGGDVEKTVKYGTNSKGLNAIINSSRGIIYAGNEEDFYEKSREKAESLKNKINKFR